MEEKTYRSWGEVLSSLGGILAIIQLLIGFFNQFIYAQMIKRMVLNLYESHLTSSSEGLRRQMDEAMGILSAEGQLRLFYEVQDIQNKQQRQQEMIEDLDLNFAEYK